MPAISREDATSSVNLLGVERRYQVIEGYTISFETYRNDLDTAHMFKGLPGDACQSPHWGVVQKGKVVFRYGDQNEVVETGAAYFARPGHTALIDAGTELIQFSPTEAHAEALSASVQNLVDALSAPKSISL